MLSSLKNLGRLPENIKKSPFDSRLDDKDETIVDTLVGIFNSFTGNTANKGGSGEKARFPFNLSDKQPSQQGYFDYVNNYRARIANYSVLNKNKLQNQVIEMFEELIPKDFKTGHPTGTKALKYFIFFISPLLMIGSLLFQGVTSSFYGLVQPILQYKLGLSMSKNYLLLDLFMFIIFGGLFLLMSVTGTFLFFHSLYNLYIKPAQLSIMKEKFFLDASKWNFAFWTLVASISALQGTAQYVGIGVSILLPITLGFVY
jgi:hypothetical protein